MGTGYLGAQNRVVQGSWVKEAQGRTASWKEGRSLTGEPGPRRREFETGNSMCGEEAL